MPVTIGSILFVNENLGLAVSAPLVDSGGYDVPSLQTGQYMVSIQPPSAAPPDAVKTEVKSGTSPVPAKYHAWKTSGLTASIKEGRNVLDFRL